MKETTTKEPTSSRSSTAAPRRFYEHGVLSRLSLAQRQNGVGNRQWIDETGFQQRSGTVLPWSVGGNKRP